MSDLLTRLTQMHASFRQQIEDAMGIDSGAQMKRQRRIDDARLARIRARFEQYDAGVLLPDDSWIQAHADRGWLLARLDAQKLEIAELKEQIQAARVDGERLRVGQDLAQRCNESAAGDRPECPACGYKLWRDTQTDHYFCVTRYCALAWSSEHIQQFIRDELEIRRAAASGPWSDPK